MAVTTQMRTQVTQLYVSLFGRAPEASGLGYWVQKLGEGQSLQTIAQDMFNVAPSRVYYPSYLTNEEIVAKFYVNVLGRTPDAGGLAYWTGRLNTESTTGTAASKMIAVGTVITEMLTAVVNTGADAPAEALASQSLLNNKVAVGLHYAVDLNGNDVAFASTLMPLVTTGPNGADLALATVDGTQSYTLTNDIDVKSANQFISTPVYTPGKNDFINSLQDEDHLTGVGINPTLTATLGSVNDSAEHVITPILTNIQTANFEITGNTSGVNFQDSTGLTTLNINRITNSNSTVNMLDLDKSTVNLSVSNATRDGNVNFLYKEDNLLATDNTLNVALSNTRLSALTIGETGDDGGEDKGYGFETVNVTVANASNIDNFTIGDNKREDTSTANASQTVNITANATTEINNLTATGAEFINLVANAEVVIAADERNILRAANDGISTADLRKLVITGAANVTIDGLNGHIDEKVKINGEAGTTLVVDASAMTGDLKLGVQAAADGNSSGVFANHTDKDVSITSGSGNDIVETYTALAGDITTGAGNDQVLINNGATTAVWTSVEGVSTIDTGTGDDTVRAQDLLATAADGNEGNQSFGEVTAASVMTGVGDDTVAVRDLASSIDTDNGVLNDSNVDDTFFFKGAAVDTGAGNDAISFRTVAEGASVSAGVGADTVTVSLIGGTILAADTSDKREVNLDKSANALGAIVDLGSDNDTISFNTDEDGSTPEAIPAVMNGTVVVTPAIPVINVDLNTLIVGQDAELRGGDGNDTLNVTALDVVNVTHQTTWTTKADDTNVNVTGIETANFTVLDQVNFASNKATDVAFNDNNETDGSITADIMRFDTDLKAINLVSEEKALLTNSLTEDYLAGTATSFTLNNFRDGIALTLKANEATGVNGDNELQDDELTDVNLTVNNAAARGHADAFTLNIAAGSGAFDLNLNLNATATDKVGNAASKTDDDDQRVEKVTINLAADDQGHRIDFNGFGDAIHTDAPLEGSKDVATSLLVSGGSAGTNLVLDNVSADVITAAGAANVAIKLAGAVNAGHNNYTITTGSGNDVINMMADNVRANNIVDDGVGEVADEDTIDGNGTITDIDEADAVNAGAGDDRIIINGNDILGADVTGPTGRQLGGRTDDDVFNKIKSVESIEVQGGGSNWITLDEAAATNGANLQNIYITGAGAQDTTVQLGENFVNKSAAGVLNTLNIDSTMDLSDVKGEVAKDASLTLTIDNQDSDQDTDLVNLNIKVGMDNGTDVNFHNTGDSAAMVTLTAIVAKNTANTVAAGLAATAGNLSIDVTTGSIDKVVLIDSDNDTDLGDNPDNGTITVNVSDAWSKTTFEFDASGIANQDAGKVANPQPAGVRETEGAGLTAATAAAQVAGIQAGDTGGLIFNGATESDAKLIVKGTANDDIITGSNQDDTLSGNDGDDIINGGNGNDSITGGNGNDDIRAGIGNDTVDAGAGDDMIFGDQGADSLTGGAGKDTFTYTSVLQSNGGNFDTITDFASADDTIVINAVVKGLDDGAVASVDFINLATFKEVSSAGAGDNSLAGNTAAADRVLGDAYYATDTGEFVVDVDGNGDITTGSDLVIKSTGKITASNVNYTINAGAGNDFIRGGQGADSLDGGAGADTFVFVGSLSNAEASAYSAAFTAAETLVVGTGAAAVLGAQLTAAGVESKVLASGDLFAARTASEVNKGDKINVAGADATDKLHVFGTADLSLVNSAAALNVGTLIVHSGVTLTNAQAIALTHIIFDGNDPHSITLKDDILVGTDTVNAILAKLKFLNAGPLSTFTINAPDGVLKAAWSTTNNRMEVVSDSRLAPVAAGTPFNGLGGATDLNDKTYASAVILNSIGITGYQIVDAAATLAAGSSTILNAATSIALTDTTTSVVTLNAIDSLTTVQVNAASVTSFASSTAASFVTAYTSSGISGLGNEPIVITDTAITSALLLQLDSLTNGVGAVVDASSVLTLTGTATSVLAAYAANTAGTISGLGNEAVTLTSTNVLASALLAIDAATSGITNISSITGTIGIQGTVAEVQTIFTNGQFSAPTLQNITLTDTSITASAFNTLTTTPGWNGTIDANSVTTITGTISQINVAYDFAFSAGFGNEILVLTDTVASVSDVTALKSRTTGNLDASSIVTLTGSIADATALYQNLTGYTGLGNEFVTIDDTAIVAADLTLLTTLTGVVNAASVLSVTGTAAEVTALYALGTGEVIGLGDEDVSVSGITTVAQFNAIQAASPSGNNSFQSVNGSAADIAGAAITNEVINLVVTNDAGTVAQFNTIEGFANTGTQSYVGLTDTAANVLASAVTVGNTVGTLRLTGTTTKANYDLVQALANTGLDTFDTVSGTAAAILAGTAINNEVVNVEVTDAAGTVANFVAIEALLNTGTQSYVGLTDNATNFAASTLNGTVGTLTITGVTTATQFTTIQGLANSGLDSFASVNDTATNIAGAAINAEVENVVVTDAIGTAAQFTTIEAFLNTGTNSYVGLTDSAANLAAAAINGTVGTLTANTAATVAEAVAIDAFANTGANTYNITDSAANLAGSTDLLLSTGGVVTANTGATTGQAATIAAFVKAVVYGITDTAANLATLFNAGTSGAVTEATGFVSDGAVTVTGAGMTTLSAATGNLSSHAVIVDGTDETVNLGTLLAFGGNGTITFGNTGGADKYTVILGSSGLTTINVLGDGNHVITANSAVGETFVFGDTNGGANLLGLTSFDVVDLLAESATAWNAVAAANAGAVAANGDWNITAGVLTYWSESDGAVETIGLVGVTGLQASGSTFVVV